MEARNTGLLHSAFLLGSGHFSDNYLRLTG